MQKLAISLILLALTTVALADTTITYQGQLRQGGEPHSGTANLEFRLYDELTGGSQIGDAEERLNWPVEEGLFQVELDFGAGAFDGSPRFLEVRVDDATLSPRQAIRPAPMALVSLAGNEGNPGDSLWSLSGDDIYYSTGKVGIGTSSPNAALAVVGPVSTGHWSNEAGGDLSFASGGGLLEYESHWFEAGNSASGDSSFVGGGAGNQAVERASFVGGGWANSATGPASFVGGGGVYYDTDLEMLKTAGNEAAGVSSFVGGGRENSAIGEHSFVGGGRDNSAIGEHSFVGGGRGNIAEGANSFIAGGFGHEASGARSFATGRSSNVASGVASFVSGGDLVHFGGAYFSAGNTSSGSSSFVGGGAFNVASGRHSFVGGGVAAVASGHASFVGGGGQIFDDHFNDHIHGPNKAEGISSFVGGGGNNTASGDQSFVAGGLGNTAAGAQSFAAGNLAQATHDGAFVWADNTDEDFVSSRPNQFRVRATGGAHFETGSFGLRSFSDSSSTSGAAVQAESTNPGGIAITGRNNSDDATMVLNNTGTGRLIRAFSGGTQLLNLENNGNLSIAGTLTQNSDRNQKEAIEPVNVDDVLDRLAGLEISSWRYLRSDNGVRHIGPMAQDFHAAFGYGISETTISAVDAQGIAFAAIQALNDQLITANSNLQRELAFMRQGHAELQARVVQMEQSNRELVRLSEANAELEARLADLEALIKGNANRTATTEF